MANLFKRNTLIFLLERKRTNTVIFTANKRNDKQALVFRTAFPFPPLAASLPHTWCRTVSHRRSRWAHPRRSADCCWAGSPLHTGPSLNSCSAQWWPRACQHPQWQPSKSHPSTKTRAELKIHAMKRNLWRWASWLAIIPVFQLLYLHVSSTPGNDRVTPIGPTLLQT